MTSISPPGSANAIHDTSRAEHAREAFVQRGLRLDWLTFGYNALEAIVSIVARLLAGSVALVGFGFDSAIEVTAAGAAQWRLRADLDPARRERVEHHTLHVIGWTLLALTAYVLYDSEKTPWLRERPERSLAGITILVLSVIVMPLLARAKRRVACGLASRALEADARQTSLCAYLSVIALPGLALKALFGWWWADPVSALVMTPVIAREGLEGVRGEECDGEAG